MNDVYWKIALKKCKDHLKWKLKNKMKSGAHSASVLGADPIDFYLSIGYQKIIEGGWEWKSEYSLTEQMIRIIDSYISKKVEEFKKPQTSASSRIEYKDIEELFYSIDDEDTGDLEEYEKEVSKIEAAILGDPELELIWDAIKEGLKRSEIAALLDKTPKQFDKIREKLIRRANAN